MATYRAQQPLLDEEESGRATKASSKCSEASLSRRAFLANVILLLGYSIGFMFQVYEFNGRDRETIAIVLYFVAFALLVLSGIIQLTVDVFGTRLVKQGRYYSGSVGWNTFISFLFISAGTLDIVAFVYWQNRQPDIEEQILLVSSYVIFIMAVLALYFQVMKIREVHWKKVIVPDKIDFIANMAVLIVAVMGVILRHMNVANVDKDVEDKLELATFPIWVFSSMLFVTTDVIRIENKYGGQGATYSNFDAGVPF